MYVYLDLNSCFFLSFFLFSLQNCSDNPSLTLQVDNVINFETLLSGKTRILVTAMHVLNKLSILMDRATRLDILSARCIILTTTQLFECKHSELFGYLTFALSTVLKLLVKMHAWAWNLEKLVNFTIVSASKALVAKRAPSDEPSSVGEKVNIAGINIGNLLSWLRSWLYPMQSCASGLAH